MNKKIYGIPVATPMNPEKVNAKKLKALEDELDALTSNSKALEDELDSKASAGFGYGEPMRWLGFNPDPDVWASTGTFQEDLEAAFAELPQGGSMQVQFIDTKLNNQKHMGTLWKYTAAYGSLTSTNYSGVRAIKTYYNNTWNDWEYLPNPNCVTPQMFGAKGDGEADDTAAFQAAINTGRPVYIPAGKRYRITDTLKITTVYQGIFGESVRGSENAGSTIYFDTDTEGKLLFSIDHHDIYFRDICILGKNRLNDKDEKTGTGYGIAFQCKNRTGSSAVDQDIEFVNVRVLLVETAIDFEGRGVKVMNCSFADLKNAFVGRWNESLETNKYDRGHKAEDGTYPDRHYTGQRGYVFQNNRFHHIRQRVVKIESGHAYGLVFENNVMDHGRGLVFDATEEAWNWIATGNVMQCLNLSKNDNDNNPTDKPATFNFSGGAKNCIFANNVFSSINGFWTSSHGPIPYHYMKFATLKDSVIASNNFDNCSSDAIVIKGAAANSVISGNTFTNIKGKHYTIGNSADFEWENPPMTLGTEYRTKKRHLGKVVYTKAYNWGNLPNTAKSAISFSSTEVNPISIKLILDDGYVASPGYNIDNNQSAKYGFYVSNTQKSIVVTTEADFSKRSAIGVVEYTKD